MKNEKGFIKNKETQETIISALALVFGAFCLALCYNLFFVPNNLVVGGTSGLSIVLEKLLGINKQLFIYITSFILIIICYIFLGKEATKRTILGSLLYPLFITFTNPIANFLLQYINFEEMIVTVVLAGILYGVSNGVIYKYGYNTGGSDIIVMLLRKYCHFSEGRGSLLFNTFIILIGLLTFGINKAVYAIIILVINSLLVDKIIIGISDSKKFMIYTRESKKVKILIEEEFKTGFTIFPTVGGYSHIRGAMIMCVIDNRDINYFRDRILEIDPTAFFVISDCYAVQGGVKSQNKRSNLPFI